MEQNPGFQNIVNVQNPALSSNKSDVLALSSSENVLKQSFSWSQKANKSQTNVDYITLDTCLVEDAFFTKLDDVLETLPFSKPESNVVATSVNKQPLSSSTVDQQEDKENFENVNNRNADTVLTDSLPACGSQRTKLVRSQNTPKTANSLNRQGLPSFQQLKKSLEIMKIIREGDFSNKEYFLEQFANQMEPSIFFQKDQPSLLQDQMQSAGSVEKVPIYSVIVQKPESEEKTFKTKLNNTLQTLPFSQNKTNLVVANSINKQAVSTRFAKGKETKENYSDIIETTTVTPYACGSCKISFESSATLAEHVQSHQKTFKCSYCSTEFATEHSCCRHEQVHVTSKECTLCSVTFSKKRELERHILMHEGERKFTCPLCLKVYVQKGRLKRHMKSHVTG